MGCGSTRGRAFERAHNKIISQETTKGPDDDVRYDETHQSVERKKYKEKSYLYNRDNNAMQIKLRLLLMGYQSFVENSAGHSQKGEGVNL